MDGTHYWVADILSASFHPVELVSRQASVQDIVKIKINFWQEVVIHFWFIIMFYIILLFFFWPAVTSPYNSNCLKTL